MYFEHVKHYDVLYFVNQMAKTMSKLFTVHMAAVKCLVCYPTETTEFAITCMQVIFRLTAFPGVDCGNNVKLTSS